MRTAIATIALAFACTASPAESRLGSGLAPDGSSDALNSAGTYSAGDSSYTRDASGELITARKAGDSVEYYSSSGGRFATERTYDGVTYTSDRSGRVRHSSSKKSTVRDIPMGDDIGAIGSAFTSNPGFAPGAGMKGDDALMSVLNSLSEMSDASAVKPSASAVNLDTSASGGAARPDSSKPGDASAAASAPPEHQEDSPSASAISGKAVHTAQSSFLSSAFAGPSAEQEAQASSASATALPDDPQRLMPWQRKSQEQADADAAAKGDEAGKTVNRAINTGIIDPFATSPAHGGGDSSSRGQAPKSSRPKFINIGPN